MLILQAPICFMSVDSFLNQSPTYIFHMTAIKQEFISPLRSLDRASKHITDLGECIDTFNTNEPAIQTRKYNRDRSQYLVVSRLTKPLPENLESIATDAIYNLRSSLDQAIYVAAILSKPLSTNFTIDMDWFGFPIRKEQENIEKWLSTYNDKGLHVSYCDLINDLEPWEQESNKDNLFYWLNSAANVNKHKFLTPVQLRYGDISGKLISGPGTLIGLNLKEFSLGGPKMNITISHPTIPTAKNELALYSGVTRLNTQYEIDVTVDVQFVDIYGAETSSCIARLNDALEFCKNVVDNFQECSKNL